MGVQRFDELRVWQEARILAERIGTILKEPGLADDPVMRAQLNAASLSIVANIAEGFVRARRREFHQFAKIAAASNAECRALLMVAQGRRYIENNKVAQLLERSDSIARMLRRLMAALE